MSLNGWGMTIGVVGIFWLNSPGTYNKVWGFSLCVIALIMMAIHHSRVTAPPVQNPKTSQEIEDDKNYQKELDDLKSFDLNTWERPAPDVLLKNGEYEYLRTDNVDWIEPRTHTSNVTYGGVTGRVRLAKGVYWRAGSISPIRSTTTELKPIHFGTLILTNKRILILQNDGSVSQVAYGSIGNIVPYTDAVGIMKTRGNNVYLYSDTFDGEKVAIILTRLIIGDYDAHEDLEPDLSESTSQPVFDENDSQTDKNEKVSQYIENLRSHNNS